MLKILKPFIFNLLEINARINKLILRLALKLNHKVLVYITYKIYIVFVRNCITLNVLARFIKTYF